MKNIIATNINNKKSNSRDQGVIINQSIIRANYFTKHITFIIPDLIIFGIEIGEGSSHTLRN